MAAAEVAEALNLSEPTMLRFAKTLGFENYPAMRVMLQVKVRYSRRPFSPYPKSIG